jgi:hypothetical protein
VTPLPLLPSTEEPSLALGDAAFRARKWPEAGRIYGTLAGTNGLPPDRRGPWAYCRAIEVVKRINARPTSPQEWAALDAEIRTIRGLAPKSWLGEYLQNLASERGRAARGRGSRSSQVIVRGNSPDEAPAAASARTASVPAQAPAPAPAPAASSGPIAWSRDPVVTLNFHVVHVGRDRALAEQVARVAESTRKVQLERWSPANAGRDWVPKCEIVLFPTAAEFSRHTLQPAESPGFSSMGMNGGKVVLRKVHLRVDHPTLVKAVLPHEVTHVVLADLFPEKQIPRWADEGMAVLAEPRDEQALRAADLSDPLRTGRLFSLTDLMGMDYPRPEHWSLYYAQSVSLTRFLVESATPEQFVRFVHEAQRIGFEPALKQTYAIPGYADLQTRWLAYARDHLEAPAAITASAAPVDAPMPEKR